MKPSHPDDAGAPSPGKPSRPGQKPVPPAVVYALDCLERGRPAQVRRHMSTLGYTAAEADDAVRAALALLDAERPSAWSLEDVAARRCMSLGFLLVVCGIVAGFTRAYLHGHITAGVNLSLNACAWGGILTGIVVFVLGIAQLRFRRR